MKTVTSRITGIAALVAALGMSTSSAASAAAPGTHTVLNHPDLVLVAYHPDSTKRHGLGYRQLTPHNPNERFHDSEFSDHRPCHPDPGKCRVSA